MALSGSITTNSWVADNGQTRNYTLSWTAKQTIANNQSSITWKIEATGTYSYQVAERTLIGTLAGKSLINKTDRVMRGPGVIASGNFTLTHGSDGKLDISGSITAAIYDSTADHKASKKWSLNQIPRQATISTAPNFSDEGNPTITYSNLAGDAVESLQACIASNDGNKVYVPYRDISEKDTSYTFELTEEERNTLRNACITSKSMTVKFYIKTVIGGNMLYSSLAKTLSIVNADPIIAAFAKDTNATALALTGDEKRMIKGFNTVLAEMSATALKGATIVSHKITNSGKSVNTESGTFSNVNSASFVFEATDSRGNTVTKTVDLTLINYITLTANISAKMTPEGVINITANGNYFNGSFGSEQNALVVQYRYKLYGETYSEWIEAVSNKSGNTYTADIAITGLDYRKRYVVQVRASDRLDRRNSVEKIMSCIPVYNWGANNFDINVPFNYMGNYMQDFVVECGSKNVVVGLAEYPFYYRKWSSGQCEIWCRSYFTGYTVGDAAADGWRECSCTINLPFELVDSRYIISFNVINANNRYFIPGYIKQTTTSFDLEWKQTTSSNEGYIYLQINGRWKEQEV